MFLAVPLCSSLSYLFSPLSCFFSAFNKCFLRPCHGLVPLPGMLFSSLSTWGPPPHPLGPPTQAPSSMKSPPLMPPDVSLPLPPPRPGINPCHCPRGHSYLGPSMFPTPSRVGVTHLGVSDTARHRTCELNKQGWPQALMSLLQAFVPTLHRP